LGNSWFDHRKTRAGVKELIKPGIFTNLHHLTSLLNPQEIFTLKGHQGPQSLVIVDTRFLWKFPCGLNSLRDLGADL